MNILNEIIEDFKKINNIKAITLAGSKAAVTNDKLSDSDIYIYADCEIALSKRNEIATKYSDKFEINNQFFETGDEWILKENKSIIDIMYRDPSWIEEQIKNVYTNHNASVGYSTCFIYNVKNSNILYDKDDWFKNLQEKISEYPEILAKNIVNKNLPLLKQKLVSSYYEQIETAIKRNDLISINHRISAFLASYFDILFAINKLWHPGEKRLLDFAKNNCNILPKDFEKNILKLLTSPINEKLNIIKNLNSDLIQVI